MDTSAWLALGVATERHHAQVVAFHRELGQGAARVTTWGIISETYTWLRYHLGYQKAEFWLREEADLEDRGVLEVVFPTLETEAGTRRELGRYPDQDLSYVDALTLYVVRTRPDIDVIFSLDHQLLLAGLPVLPGPQGADRGGTR